LARRGEATLMCHKLGATVRRLGPGCTAAVCPWGTQSRQSDRAIAAGNGFAHAARQHT
jgi:hypothetical protein